MFSNGLPSSETAGHAVYIPSADAELLSGYTWDISYGDGSSASGDVYLDYVNVGGVTATSQAVEAAETISSEFEQDASDGLMGLAFSSINTGKNLFPRRWLYTELDSPTRVPVNFLRQHSVQLGFSLILCGP